MKTIIGIDPGKTGGIAVRYWNGFLATDPMPETEGDFVGLMFDVLSRIGEHNVVAVIEHVSAFPGQGAAAMFTFGEGFGFMKGVFMTLEVPIELVRPQKWQKHFSLGTKKKAGDRRRWKNKLKAHAQRLFPEVEVTLENADALLILKWYEDNCGN